MCIEKENSQEILCWKLTVSFFPSFWKKAKKPNKQKSFLNYSEKLNKIAGKVLDLY